MQNLFKDYHFKLKLFSFLALLIIIFYRSPYILLNSRFVSEEGFYWFRNSYVEGPIYGLFQIFWQAGYFNLWANIGSVLALIPPIEYAPFATVYLSLFLKLFIIYYILNSSSSLLINIYYKVISSFLVILSPPIVPEIWLNTLNSQSFFGILTVLIFFQNNEDQKPIHATSPYVLFIGGMSALYVCALSPFFLVKYLLTKNKTDFKNFIFIAFATLIQFAIVIYTKVNNMVFDVRFQPSIEKLINYCYNVVVKSILGRETSQYIIGNLYNINTSILLIIFLCFIFIAIYLFIFLTKKEKDKTLIFLFLFFITESLLVFIGSWGSQVQGRYAVVPGIILLFIFLRLVQYDQKIIKIISMIIIFFSLMAGSYEFKHNAKYPSFLICMGCPHWKEEIKIWKNNPNYRIKIWNYPNKYMYLNINHKQIPGWYFQFRQPNKIN